MSYDLRADVRNVLDTTSLADPGDIADKVAESVPGRALRQALRVTMRSFVREMIRDARNQTSGSSQRCNDTQPTAAAAGRTNPSWKRDGIREAWQRHLRDRYHVDGTWMQLSDMSAPALRTAAAERQTIADRNRVEADRLSGWADALDKHKAKTFGDLPSDVQRRLLGGAA